jgi:hypothetical protein
MESAVISEPSILHSNCVLFSLQPHNGSFLPHWVSIIVTKDNSKKEITFLDIPFLVFDKSKLKALKGKILC